MQAIALVVALSSLITSVELIVLKPQTASATVTSTINYQARLENASGSIVADGDYNVEFKLYKSLASGASAQGVCVGGATDDCLWLETRTSTNKVHVVNGYLTVNLGSVTAFGALNWNQQMWLTMNIGGTGSPSWDGEMSPRIQLTALPYAFQAGELGNGTNKATFDSSGNIVFQQASTIKELSATSGTQLTIQGGAATSGTNVGGNLLLQGGAGASTGASGSVIVESNGNNSTSAFQVQNASTVPVLTVDTSNGKLILGQTGGSGINGQLVFNSATASNYTTTIIASGSQTATYSLTLPTSGPSTSQCLKTDATTASQLTFASCGSGGGGVTLQGSTPGTADTGNFNVTGTGIAGVLQAGSGTAVTTFNVFTSDTSVGGAIIQNTDTATHGISFAPLIIQHDSNTNGDSTGIRFRLKNSSGTATTYGLITSVIQSSTASSEIGQLVFSVNNTGTVQPVMTINGVGVCIQQATNCTPTYPLTVIGDTDGSALGPVTVKSTSAGGSIGTSITLDASPATGGHAWSVISTGPGNTNGAGYFGLFDSTASKYRVLIDASGNLTVNSSTSNVQTTLNGTALVKPTSGNDSATAFQVQNASGTNIFNVDTSNSKVGTPNVSAASTNSQAFNIASGNSTTSGNTGDVTIKSGDATSGNSGSLTFNVGTASGTRGSINIGTIGSTATSSTINIANTTGNATQTVNIGATNSASNAVLIQGGTGASAISLQSGASGTISIGSNNTANTIQIGSSSLSSGTQTINIGNGNTAGGTTNILIGSTIAGTVTLQPAGGVALGVNNSQDAKLLFNNASGTATVTVQTGATSASYTIKLPTAIGSAGQCLSVGSVASTTEQLSYSSCSGAGVGTVTINLIPEYVGATFSQYDYSGSSSGTNTGFMQSDHVAGLASGQGYKHNYYQWSTDQSAAQDYHIITEYQIPTGFSSFATGTFKIWTYIDSSTSTDLKFTMADVDGTVCYSSLQSIKPGSTATWTQTTLSDPGNGCSFAAGDIVTFDIKLVAIQPSTNYVKVGELQFGYN